MPPLLAFLVHINPVQTLDLPDFLSSSLHKKVRQKRFMDLMKFSSLPCVLHSPLISSSLSTSYAASQHAILLLDPPIFMSAPCSQAACISVRPQSDRYVSHPNQLTVDLLAVLTLYRIQPNASLCLQAYGLLLLKICGNWDTEWGVYVCMYVCICVCIGLSVTNSI